MILGARRKAPQIERLNMATLIDALLSIICIRTQGFLLLGRIVDLLPGEFDGCSRFSAFESDQESEKKVHK